MDYNDAKMERGADRQALLERLQHRVWEMEHVGGRLDTQAVLSEVITQHLLRREGIYLPNYADSDTQDIFLNELLPAIKEFARTDEEANALVASLLAWVNQSFVGHFSNLLMLQENHQPELLFTGDDRQGQMI